MNSGAAYQQGRSDALDEVAHMLELHALHGFGDVTDMRELVVKRRMERERDVVAQVRAQSNARRPCPGPHLIDSSSVPDEVEW